MAGRERKKGFAVLSRKKERGGSLRLSRICPRNWKWWLSRRCRCRVKWLRLFVCLENSQWRILRRVKLRRRPRGNRQITLQSTWTTHLHTNKLDSIDSALSLQTIITPIQRPCYLTKPPKIALAPNMCKSTWNTLNKPNKISQYLMRCNLPLLAWIIWD